MCTETPWSWVNMFTETQWSIMNMCTETQWSCVYMCTETQWSWVNMCTETQWSCVNMCTETQCLITEMQLIQRRVDHGGHNLSATNKKICFHVIETIFSFYFTNSICINMTNDPGEILGAHRYSYPILVNIGLNVLISLSFFQSEWKIQSYKNCHKLFENYITKLWVLKFKFGNIARGFSLVWISKF